MKSFFIERAALLSIAAIALFIDQASKAWVRSTLQLQQVWAPSEAIEAFARLVHLQNEGTVGGLFTSMSGFFTLLAVVVSGIIIVIYPRLPIHDGLIRVGLGLILGGALGNLADRLARGTVTDFISIGDLPIFNLADLWLITGVVLVLYSVWAHPVPHSPIQDAPPPDA